MRTKNSKPITANERRYLHQVKSMSCVVCDCPPPSEAHHIKQGDHFSTVPLCQDCHRGSHNGWHGQKAMWRIKKMDETDALTKTIGALFENGLIGVL